MWKIVYCGRWNRNMYRRRNLRTLTLSSNLLPAFDSLVLGYADREYLVPGRYQKEVYHGGQTVPVVLINGLVAGVWRYERRGKTLDIRVTLFGPADRAIKDLVAEETEDIRAFFPYENVCCLPWLTSAYIVKAFSLACLEIHSPKIPCEPFASHGNYSLIVIQALSGELFGKKFPVRPSKTIAICAFSACV